MVQSSASFAGTVGRRAMRTKPKTKAEKVRGKSDFIDMEMNRPPQKAKPKAKRKKK